MRTADRKNRPRGLSLREALAWDLAHKTQRTSEGCIEWVSGRDTDGYALTGWYGHTFRVSRLVYTELVGDLGSSDVVMHTCDNPPCVNVDHLVRGSQADNAYDRDSKGRGSAGERHYGAKLNWYLAQDIRELHRSGRSFASIAREYGLGETTVAGVCKGERWNVPPREVRGGTMPFERGHKHDEDGRTPGAETHAHD